MIVNQIVQGSGGGGGGISVDGIAYGNEPSGAITITATGAPTIRQYAFNKCQNITAVTIQGSPYVSSNAFRECTGITTLNAPDLTRLYASNYNTAQYVFTSCSSLQTVVLPNYGNYAVDSYNFQNCTSLKLFDIKNTNKIGASVFYGDTNLDTLVIRKTDSVPQLTNLNSFTSTPFASDGTGGTLYVPNSLISSYQSASNWSTLLGYANNQIKSIESTHTDPTAPIDLTLYYADGTVIPT